MELAQGGVCIPDEWEIIEGKNFVQRIRRNGEAESIRVSCGVCSKEIVGKPKLFRYWSLRQPNPRPKEGFFAKLAWDFIPKEPKIEPDSNGKVAPKIMEKSVRNASGKSDVLEFRPFLELATYKFDDFVKSDDVSTKNWSWGCKNGNKTLWIYSFYTHSHPPDKFPSEWKDEWQGKKTPIKLIEFKDC